MSEPVLSVKELTDSDIPLITDYWLSAPDEFLTGMGVDLGKMPSREQWYDNLQQQIGQPYREKLSYCMIWLLDGEPVGHTNINKIKFGVEAYMHLHLWKPGLRNSGYGIRFVKMAIPYFFKNMELKKLYCEPYAFNPAPNKALEKLGFRFVGENITTPGWLNFEQRVRFWEMGVEDVEDV